MVDLKIVDDDGKRLPEDGKSIGNLYIRGNTIAGGYYNNEEASKAAIDDEGYFGTGDVASIDEQGFLRLTDRAKDLIKSGYSVDRISNYTSLPVEEVDKKTLDFFEKKPPDVIFIYSSRSAKNLFNLINKYSLLNVVTQSNLMCISEKVLAVLKQIKWKKVFVFSPGEEEFLLNKIR